MSPSVTKTFSYSPWVTQVGWSKFCHLWFPKPPPMVCLMSFCIAFCCDFLLLYQGPFAVLICDFWLLTFDFCHDFDIRLTYFWLLLFDFYFWFLLLTCDFWESHKVRKLKIVSGMVSVTYHLGWPKPPPMSPNIKCKTNEKTQSATTKQR